MSSSKPPLRTIFSQPSWVLKGSRVEAALTVKGGQLAPVTFDLGKGRKIQPFHVAPWHAEKASRKLPGILEVLRGDFFCMPFGGNATPFGRERHPIHGEPANAKWTFAETRKAGGELACDFVLRTSLRKGSVRKTVRLVDGHAAVYQRHLLSIDGPMSFGHHANLAFPDRPGSGLISTSRIRAGRVFDGVFEKAEEYGYSSLKAGASFRDLRRVPRADGGFADLVAFPARKGFTDLAQVATASEGRFAWSAVAFPEEGYAWFALKDPKVLTSSLLWFSHGGRHYAPWSGRHLGCLGFEEITSNFHHGLAESVAPNAWSEKGIPTFLKLDAKKPLAVNTIMALVAIPRDFGRVASIREKDGGVELRGESGRKVASALDVDWLGI